MTRAQREDFRCAHIGILFQTMRVLSRLNVSEQLTFAAGRAPDPQGNAGARPALSTPVGGLQDLEAHLPEQLSGGQQARLAMTVCLMRDVRFVLADEPTAALDATASAVLMELLRESARERGCVCVLATHDPLAIDAADHVLALAKH